MLGQIGVFAAFEPLDVGFDVFGHFDQDRGGAAVEYRFGEAAALFGPGAHSLDDHAVFIGHKGSNSPMLSAFPPFRACIGVCDALWPTCHAPIVPERDSPERRVAPGAARVRFGQDRLANPFASRRRLGTAQDSLSKEARRSVHPAGLFAFPGFIRRSRNCDGPSVLRDECGVRLPQSARFTR